jgi:hypothetical protein
MRELIVKRTWKVRKCEDHCNSACWMRVDRGSRKTFWLGCQIMILRSERATAICVARDRQNGPFGLQMMREIETIDDDVRTCSFRKQRSFALIRSATVVRDGCSLRARSQSRWAWGRG